MDAIPTDKIKCPHCGGKVVIDPETMGEPPVLTGCLDCRKTWWDTSPELAKELKYG